MKLYSALNTLPPVFTSSPRWFYTKRIPSWAYLRRTRKVFTRGNAVCNIRPDIKRAQSTPSRTHTLSLSIGPQKINRSEPFLQIQIAGRGNRAASACSSRSSFSFLFVRLSKTFRRVWQNVARHGSAIRCQNKKFDSRDRERKSLPHSRNRSLFSEFFGTEGDTGWRWRNKEIRHRGNLSMIKVVMKHWKSIIPIGGRIRSKGSDLS